MNEESECLSVQRADSAIQWIRVTKHTALYSGRQIYPVNGVFSFEQPGLEE